MAIVFCKCKHMMSDLRDGTVTCLNPFCSEYGKDYTVEVLMKEKVAHAA